MTWRARVARVAVHYGLLSALGGAVSAPIASAQPSPRIVAVRFWSLGDVTRVAIETSREAEYRSELVADPEQLVIDLPGVRRQAGTRGLQTIDVNDKLLKQIRIALWEPGTTRVVLDLAGPVTQSISQLTNPNRIMIELRAPGTGVPTPPVRSVTGSHIEPPPEPEPAATAPAPRRSPAVEPPKSAVPAAEVKPIAPAIPAAASSRTQAPPAASDPAPPKPRITETAAATTNRSAIESPTARPQLLPPAEKKPDTAEKVSVETASRTAPPLASPNVPSRTPAAAEPPAAKPAAQPRRTAVEPKPAAPDVARAAQRDSRGDTTLTRALGLKLGRVVIDAGHGGHDTGTIGPTGLMEKNLVLDVAKRLGALIEQRLGSEVVYTRMDDTFIPLEDRTQIANDKKADLFLSIHANSSRLTRIAGSETFYLNLTTSEDALEVAARENATSQTSIHELQDIIQKITLNEKVQESREFASAIQKSLYAGVPRNRGLRNRGVKKAPFVVLVGAKMPSILAEIAFLSNPRDESLLKRPDYRQKIAEALLKGVTQYANTLSHFEVAQKQRQASAPAQ